MARSRIVRFLVVGAVSTGFSYGVYALLVYAGLNYAVANFAALCAGILFSFKAQGTYVFENSDNRLIWRFGLSWLAIYAANVLFIKAMLLAGVNTYMAGLIPVPAIAALSYIVQRYFVFGRRARVAWRPTP